MTQAIKCCPHCGHDEFYKRGRISGIVIIHERFDGKLEYSDKFLNQHYVDNSSMYDLTKIKMQTARFCSNCQKKLPKQSEVQHGTNK